MSNSIKNAIAMAALFALAIALIMTGLTGSVGRLLACIVVPSQVVENTTS